MTSAIYHRFLSGRSLTFQVFVFVSVIVAGGLLFSAKATAQEANPAPLSPPAAQTGGAATSVAALTREAEQNNPEIAAAVHGWQAATHVPEQASAFPEMEVSVQQFAVGSPRPFAGFSNSDFAYIGFGASQDLPWPGKRELRGKVADRKRVLCEKIRKGFAGESSSH